MSLRTLKRFFLTTFVLIAGLLTGLAGLAYTAPVWTIEQLSQVARNQAGLITKSVQVDQHRMVYLTNRQPVADAPTVVMVHGFGANKDIWLGMAALLNDINLIIPDMPAAGSSSYYHDTRYDAVSQVRRLHGLITQLTDAPVVMVGNSLGGYLTTVYASLYPEQIDSIVLFNNAGVDSAAQRSQFVQAFDQGHNLLIPHDETGFDRMMELVFSQPPYLPLVVKQVFMQRTFRETLRKQHIFEDSLRHFIPLEPLLTHLSQPLTVVWGQDDQVFDVSTAARILKLQPKAVVTVLEHIGHVPLIEAPLVSANLLRSHLQQNI